MTSGRNVPAAVLRCKQQPFLKTKKQCSCPHLQLGDLRLQLPHLRLLAAAELAQQGRPDLSLNPRDAVLHMDRTVADK